MSRVKFTPNLLDRLIAKFDPVRGARRYQARMQVNAAEAYTGASKKKRSLSGWATGGGSANADGADVSTLRERSRDLARNAPIATGAIATIVQRTIGTGLAWQPSPDFTLLGITEDQAGEWAETARAEFERWAESTECDASRAGDFYALQALTYRAAKESGDVFALLPMLPDTRRMYALAVHLIEADRVTNPSATRDTERFAQGVESGSYGEPIAYHIAKAHPGELGGRGARIETDRILAFGPTSNRRNVLHITQKLRPGQSRGIPYLAPIIEPLKQLTRYTEAEIDAAVMSAFFAVFVKSPDGSGINPMASAVSGDVDTGARTGAWDGTLGSGLVVDLAAGEEIQSAIANRPNTAFDGFVMSIFRQVGVALSIPVEVLLKHFESSYTAARAALLDLWIFVTCERAQFAAQFCQPIVEEFIAEAVARGRLNAPGFVMDARIRAAWCRGAWVGDGPGSIDPTKEITAARDRIAANISTLDRECMLHDGSSWRDVARQRGREREFIAAQGGSEPAPTGAQPQQAQPREPAQPDEETDDDNEEDQTDE